MVSLRGWEIPNHGLVATEDIGVDPYGRHLEVGLSCSTTYDMCCFDFNDTEIDGQRPSGLGSWLYAHTSHYVYRQEDRTQNYLFGIKRSGNAVYLVRNHYNQTRISVSNGIWRCVIPDVNGTEQTKYIGVYSSGTNNG